MIGAETEPETLYPFIARIINIHGWLLYGWCHVKLLLSRRKFCVHHSSMQLKSITWLGVRGRVGKNEGGAGGVEARENMNIAF